MKIKKILLIIFVLLFGIGLISLGIWCGYFIMRGHGNVVCSSPDFKESNKMIRNPNRGFYRIHGFRIHDDQMDFAEEIKKRYNDEDNTTLTMIQVNLEDFREGPISNQGLNNIQNLFENMQKTDKQWIVRFLYDWSGKANELDPEDIHIILNHMKQVAPLINQNADNIFTLQGLFIGNVGEMNGTSYTNQRDLELLANQLADCTSEDIFLSVRTPMFWRVINQTANLAEMEKGRGTKMDRLGLYNDGMLGSATDYGTYGVHTQAEDGDFSKWTREEEISFQNKLCQNVPQGGEVIVENAYNDFENALQDLREMHVTYINKDYDQAVFDKWKNYIVQEDSCYQGMDGLSYMERHLGYRLYLNKVQMDYHYAEDQVSLRLYLKNSGFAPLYKKAKVELLLRDVDTDEIRELSMDADEVMNLSGANEKESVCVSQELFFKGEEPKTYEVYFGIKDCASEQRILFANDSEMTEYGYMVGTIQLLDTPLTKKRGE
ncbi:MAG: DUF4832 domain-containing protein [Eubacteriales bacterium]|nr:DUF4832 domain-containing protein [Eubacteriales bacterium]